jgi:hypothetical protein
MVTMLLAAGAISNAGGQTSASGLPLSGWPAQIAFAGGGAAAWGDPTRTTEFPALAWLGPHTGAYASFGMPRPDIAVRSLRAGAFQQLRTNWSLTVSADWRGTSDVIDDPSVPSAGLGISDWGLRVGVGRHFSSLRTSVGGTVQLLRANVFGTRAGGERLGLSVLSQPSQSVLVVVALTDVGRPLRYQSGDSTWLGERNVPATLLGFAVRIHESRTWTQRMYVDIEKQAGTTGRSRMSLASDLVLWRTVTLRAGVSGLQDPAYGGGWKSLQAGGIAVRVAQFVFEYSVTSSLTTDDLAPRHHLGFGWGVP